VWNLPTLAKLTDCLLVEVALLLIGLSLQGADAATNVLFLP
jgi:hypothetical protein